MNDPSSDGPVQIDGLAQDCGYSSRSAMELSVMH